MAVSKWGQDRQNGLHWLHLSLGPLHPHHQAQGVCLLQAKGRGQGSPRIIASSAILNLPAGEGSKIGSPVLSIAGTRGGAALSQGVTPGWGPRS